VFVVRIIIPEQDAALGNLCTSHAYCISGSYCAFPTDTLALLFHLPGFSTIAILYESIVVIVLSVAICWTVYRGNRAARYLVLGVIPLVGLASPAILYTYSLMDYSVLTHYGYQFGSVAEFILLAFALSYQSRQNQVDKEKAQEQMIAIQEQLVQTLEHWNEELELTVKERTDKLVQSHKKRNELLQNISHDIRTPLTVVQGGIRAMMLGIQVEPGEKDKFTQKIYDKVLFITRFIDDLFMLSRFDESMAYDVVEEVQAKEWINREFEILTEDIRMTGHLCGYRLHGKANPAMTIDQHGIRRVLSNLIHNTCKFSPLGIIYLKGIIERGNRTLPKAMVWGCRSPKKSLSIMAAKLRWRVKWARGVVFISPCRLLGRKS
jgi:signal transduction histidine kinase